MKYTALGISDNHITTLATDSEGAQDIADIFGNVEGNLPQRIVLMRNGPTFQKHTSDSTTLTYQPPELVRTFEYGKDYFARVQTLDAACETIKDWIDNLDDPQSVLRLLKEVTGVEQGAVIGTGDNARIAYNVPGG